jgi:enolase-phosphatase E1
VPFTPEPSVCVILLDIEGTTTPVDFVYKTLFPYARQKMQSFLRQHSDDPEIRSLVAQLRIQHQRDEAGNAHPSAWNHETDDALLDSSVAYAHWLMARDSKCTPLKVLQGRIWQAGYARGELRGEVYDDVPRALQRWQRQQREISIYSSGSILAQTLLFQTTKFGDLTRHISAFFDTQVGAKNETESYRKIVASLGHAPAKALFISDAAKEIEAAQAAGMPAILCQRDVNPPASAINQPVIRTFDELFPD